MEFLSFEKTIFEGELQNFSLFQKVYFLKYETQLHLLYIQVLSKKNSDSISNILKMESYNLKKKIYPHVPIYYICHIFEH